jgi:hypothetical protein
MKKATFVCLMLVPLLLAACSAAGREADADVVTGIRTPRPTFTPAPVVQPEPPAGQPQVGQDESPPAPQAAPQPPAGETARVVVNSPLVNVRAGPGTTYDIITIVERGQEYEIVGRNAEGSWWFVCCADSDYVWIFNDLVDTDGPVDSVPITGAAADTPADDVTVVTPEAPAAAPLVQFDLIRQEQFAESALVRVYLYVTADSVGIEGYSARITKDGRELPVDAISFGGQPAFTWPFQDARQRHQNFKVEFTDEPPAGVWSIQLVNADGVAVGPAAQFTLTTNDPNQELYLRYEQR